MTSITFSNNTYSISVFERICGYCHKTIDGDCVHILDGDDYHESCWRLNVATDFENWVTRSVDKMPRRAAVDRSPVPPEEDEPSKREA